MIMNAYTRPFALQNLLPQDFGHDASLTITTELLPRPREAQRTITDLGNLERGQTQSVVERCERE